MIGIVTVVIIVISITIQMVIIIITQKGIEERLCSKTRQGEIGVKR